MYGELGSSDSIGYGRSARRSNISRGTSTHLGTGDNKTALAMEGDSPFTAGGGGMDPVIGAALISGGLQFLGNKKKAEEAAKQRQIETLYGNLDRERQARGDVQSQIERSLIPGTEQGGGDLLRLLARLNAGSPNA